MGNLQTEFDFFIKNQQAVGEKESPGSSPAPPCPSLKVFHHLSPRQPAWEDLYQLFNESCCCYLFIYFFFRQEKILLAKGGGSLAE